MNSIFLFLHDFAVWYHGFPAHFSCWNAPTHVSHVWSRERCFPKEKWYSITWLKAKVNAMFQALAPPPHVCVFNFSVCSKSILRVSFTLHINSSATLSWFHSSSPFPLWTMRIKLHKAVCYQLQHAGWRENKGDKRVLLGCGSSQKKDGSRKRKMVKEQKKRERVGKGDLRMYIIYYRLFIYVFILTFSCIFIYLFFEKTHWQKVSCSCHDTKIRGDGMSSSIMTEEDEQRDEGEEAARLHFWRSRTHLRHFQSWKREKK